MTSKRAQDKAKRANDRRLKEAIADAQEGRVDRAVRSLDALCARVPSNARYQFERAKILAAAGQLAAARNGYKRAVELSPSYAEAAAALAELSPADAVEPPAAVAAAPAAAQPAEWVLTRGPSWKRILEDLDGRGVARVPGLAPPERRTDEDFEALAAELHQRLAQLALDWAARLPREPAWPADVAARRRQGQAWAARLIEAPLTLEAPVPDVPAHLPLHALVALGPGALELERADLRPGRRRASAVTLEPGDVGLCCVPSRPVVIANTPALQPLELELQGRGVARLLF